MNIQFESLPVDIQQEILRHLQLDNFKEAKRLRDTYQKRKAAKPLQELEQTDEKVTKDKKDRDDMLHDEKDRTLNRIAIHAHLAG